MSLIRAISIDDNEIQSEYNSWCGVKQRDKNMNRLIRDIKNRIKKNESNVNLMWKLFYMVSLIALLIHGWDRCWFMWVVSKSVNNPFVKRSLQPLIYRFMKTLPFRMPSKNARHFRHIITLSCSMPNGISGQMKQSTRKHWNIETLRLWLTRKPTLGVLWLHSF